MRCSEAIHTLSTSASRHDSDPLLAAHLASCPGCADWAADDAHVLRVWQATRPAEPSTEAWDALWTRVSGGLDSAERSRVVTMPARAVPRFRLSLVALGLAQAAAILVAVVLLPGRQPHRVGRPGLLAQSSPTVRFVKIERFVEIDAGETAMLREKAGRLVKEPIAFALDDRSVDGNFDMLNVFESMAVTDGRETGG